MKMTYGSTQIWAVIKKHVKWCPGPITVMLSFSPNSHLVAATLAMSQVTQWLLNTVEQPNVGSQCSQEGPGWAGCQEPCDLGKLY